MKKQEREITWLDTYCEGGYSYEDYKQWCEDNEVDADVEGSEDYWDWIREMIADDVECFFDNLKYEKGIVQQPCVISGRLGLWWGRPSIENETASNLGDAVKKCWGDCDAVRVTSKGGVVYVVAMHHDGRNCFEIRPLTERGKREDARGRGDMRGQPLAYRKVSEIFVLRYV